MSLAADRRPADKRSIMTEEPIQVLLIEDSTVDARIIEGQLSWSESVQFEVTVCATLAEGMDRVERGRTDVLLLDLTLPDSQGFETFLKTFRLAPHVPIVVITALDDAGVATDAVRSGAQDYLVKGKIDSQSLSHAVLFAIERHRSLRWLNPHLAGLRPGQKATGGPADSTTNGEKIHTPLSQNDPDTFQALCTRYRKLLDLAKLQRTKRELQNISQDLHGLAMYLCMLQAGASDIEAIHRAALELAAPEASQESMQAYVEEGQLLLIEIMRYLADFYRDCALGGKASVSTDGSPG